MAMREITVRNRMFERIVVDADVSDSGLLAVHRGIHHDADGFVITHIGTGGVIKYFPTQAQALKSMRAIEGLDCWNHDDIGYFIQDKDLGRKVMNLIKESTT